MSLLLTSYLCNLVYRKERGKRKRKVTITYPVMKEWRKETKKQRKEVSLHHQVNKVDVMFPVDLFIVFPHTFEFRRLVCI